MELFSLAGAIVTRLRNSFTRRRQRPPRRKLKRSRERKRVVPRPPRRASILPLAHARSYNPSVLSVPIVVDGACRATAARPHTASYFGHLLGRRNSPHPSEQLPC